VTALGVPERRDAIPDRDATVVRRITAAGGILLGKTNCPPWGGGLETDNDLYGRTNNPYDLERTPGGSSGGEAAAIASGMSVCGLGSDSGGSVRYPAHFCGLASIKPTAGLVPLTGMLDDLGQIGSMRDPRTQIGPLARSIDDVALVLRTIAGPDGIDASAIPIPVGRLDEVPIEDLRVAIQYYIGEADPSDETIRAVTEAAEALRERGAKTSEAELPDEGFELTRRIWMSYSGKLSPDSLYQVLAEWDRYRFELMTWIQDFDLIIRPVNATPAPPHGSTSDATLNTLPFSLTGWPAATVRCGTSPEGLPIGVQVIAHPWQDHIALAAARVLESAYGGWQPPSDKHLHFP
jgi:amidase